MANEPSTWLAAPNVTWRWALGAALGWFLALYAFDGTQLARDLEYKVTRPFEFRIRDELGRSPKLDPRIRVFGFDDSTVAWMGGPSPSVELWAKLFRNIADVEPAAIIVDGMFSINAIPEGHEESAAEAIRQLEDRKSTRLNSSH